MPHERRPHVSLRWRGGGKSPARSPREQSADQQMTKGEDRDHKNRDTHLSNHTLKSSQSAHLNTTRLSHACRLLTELKVED